MKTLLKNRKEIGDWPWLFWILGIILIIIMFVDGWNLRFFIASIISIILGFVFAYGTIYLKKRLS